MTVPVVQLPGFRELAVLVQPYGKPATGYTVSAVAADPKLVTVQGAPVTISELSGYITVPQMVRAGFVLNITGISVITALGWWLIPHIVAGRT